MAVRLFIRDVVLSIKPWRYKNDNSPIKHDHHRVRGTTAHRTDVRT